MLKKIMASIWTHYGFMSLLVMLPLLVPGYILTLDLVFVPHIAWPTELSNTWVFQSVLHIGGLIVPSDVIEKLLLVAVLVLCGVGAHKLVRHIAANDSRPFLVWGAYFAGIFYTINPFTYSRFMAGQYLVLLGYALTPFFIVALMRFIKEPGWRTAFVVAAWTIAIAGVSLHHIGIVIIATATVGLAMLWHYRKQAVHVKRVLIFGTASVAIVAIANSYWLVPTLLGATGISQATASFNQVQYDAFATNGDSSFGAIGNVIRLQGFWAEPLGLFILPQQQVPVWGLVMVAVWFLVGVGAVRLWRENRSLAVGLSVAALVVVVLAATPIVSWLSDIVPFVAGYREPQKFIALLALIYALLGGVGVAGLVERLSQSGSCIATSMGAAALLIVPILCTPTMLWGFNGQLAPKQYPADWYAVNAQLQGAHATKLLFLPWHQYINFSFSNRTIANPATKFFSVPTVSGDNPEFKGIEPTVPSTENRRIEQEVLLSGNHTSELGKRLASFGFSHVLLAKEYDYEDYTYLDKQADLRLISDTENLRVYEVVKNDGGTK